MSDTLYVSKLNEVYIRVSSPDQGIEADLSDAFTFQVPDYKFMPAYRNGTWDGKIRLYNTRDRTIYAGLLEQIQKFAKDRDYNIEFDSTVPGPCNFPLTDAQSFIQGLNLSDGIIPRDYQINAFREGVMRDRATFLSPTASGKSLMIYILARFFNVKTLIIVPTINLVHQMESDFKNYGYTEAVHKICKGADKRSDCPITISTWQSIYKLPEQYFKQYQMVIGDEVHTFKATSLVSIMTKLKQCPHRFGFTGTLDGMQTNEKVIQGLFGPIVKVTTTKELIENKTLSSFNVRAMLLDYPDVERRYSRSLKYADEVDFLVRHPRRNEFIRRLATHVKGNTLVLFQFVEKHGEVLYDLIRKSTDRPVYYVSGKVEGEEREIIRKVVETESNAIIVASVGVFSTGINIVSLKNIIFASPSKSRIRVLQSIGRVLRKSNSKTEAVLFDIADDLKWKTKPNYTYLHFAHRLKIYTGESFPYKIHKVKI